MKISHLTLCLAALLLGANWAWAEGNGNKPAGDKPGAGQNPNKFVGGQGGFKPGNFQGGQKPAGGQGGFAPGNFQGGVKPGMQGGFKPNMQGGFKPGNFQGGFKPGMQPMRIAPRVVRR